MSQLSNVLAEILDQNGLRQHDVTKQTGLGVATVSRIFTGEQEFVSVDALDKIISVIAKSDKDRSRIVQARLLDAYDGRYAECIKMTLKGGSAPPTKVKWPIAIDPEVKAAVEYLLRLVPKKPAVGEALVQLARMMGMPE